jgi:hypothetical protein
VANPWSAETKNVNEQMLIAKEKPPLAAFLKSCANGVTYSILKQEREAKAKRAALREIEYNSEVHE